MMVQAIRSVMSVIRERISFYQDTISEQSKIYFILFFPFSFGWVYLTGCQVSRTSLDIDLKDLKVCDIIMRLDLIICCPAAHRQVWARI